MHDNVVVKQRVNAPLEKVWSAITNKAQMREWYFDIPDFELKEGASFNFYEPGEERKYRHHCEISEVVANKKLKYSWSYPDISKEKTLVKWELQPDGKGTYITLTHKGLENFEHLGKDFRHESFEQGWNEILGSSLKEFVEK